MNKINFLSITALTVAALTTAAAHAELGDSQYYIGAQVGMGFTNLNDKDATIRGLESITGQHASYSNRPVSVTGRVYAGYMITPIVGVESGYGVFSRTKSSGSSTLGENTIDSHATNNVSSFDLLGVYAFPFTPELTVSLKAGGAIVMNKYKVSATVDGADVGINDSQSSTTFRGKFGITADYKVHRNTALGLSYEITQGSGKPFSTRVDGNDLIVDGNKRYSPMFQVVSLDVKYTF